MSSSGIPLAAADADGAGEGVIVATDELSAPVLPTAVDSEEDGAGEADGAGEENGTGEGVIVATDELSAPVLPAATDGEEDAAGTIDTGAGVTLKPIDVAEEEAALLGFDT